MQGVLGNDEAADMLRQVARKAHQFLHQCDQVQGQPRVALRSPSFSKLLRQRRLCRRTSTGFSTRTSTSHPAGSPSGLADIPHRHFAADGQIDGRRQRRHGPGRTSYMYRITYLAALVCSKSTADGSWLGALTGNKRSNNIDYSRRIDFGARPGHSTRRNWQAEPRPWHRMPCERAKAHDIGDYRK